VIAETFLALLTAHLVGDFIAQNEWMVANKKRGDVLVLHVLIVTAIAALTLGVLDWGILAITFATHLASDAVKARLTTDSLAAFLADQAFHIAVAAALALTLPVDFGQNALVARLGQSHQNYYFAGLALAAGLITAVQVGAIVVRKFFKKYASQITEQPNGIKGAGALIGKLERLLVVVFIISGQVEGIGFLVAAKSILRFGEISQAKDRNVSEYIIIGTFLSFAWGIVCALVTAKALVAWPI
jgi:hypothetical protein